MRLTTKGRFAVTAMIDVAMNGTKGPATLAGVSQRQKQAEKQDVAVMQDHRTAGPRTVEPAVVS